MARKYENVRWYWPAIGNLADAVQASNTGFWAAVYCGTVTAVLATISIFAHSDIGGVTALSYLDAVLFAVVAVGTRYRSRFFAVAGLCLFVLEKIAQFATQPKTVGFGIVLVVILLLAFITGVRGTFAFHRLRRPDDPAEAAVDA